MPAVCPALSLCAALCLPGLLLPAAARAQKYPEKPIRLVVPFGPGGGADIFGRIVAQRLSETVGTMVVENRPGAGSTVGMEHVAKSAAYGYTLLLSSAAFSAAPALYPKLGYDPVKDFAPVSVVTTVPLVILAHPSLPVRNVQDLIKLARAKPGALNYSTAGPGSLIHLAGESFMAATKTQRGRGLAPTRRFAPGGPPPPCAAFAARAAQRCASRNGEHAQYRFQARNAASTDRAAG